MMITKLKVLKSNAGYYIGTQYFDKELNTYLPNSRDSAEYYSTYKDASTALEYNSYTYRLHP
jgi:hypothetical protein